MKGDEFAKCKSRKRTQYSGTFKWMHFTESSDWVLWSVIKDKNT